MDLGSELFSAGSGLVGGLFGLVGQRKANQMNMKINQMNNEFNERMLDKQLAFQQSMFDQANEYNSAVNQRARLEAAGLNPYMMMSGGNAGTATAMSGGITSAANPLSMQNAGAAAAQGVSAVGNFITQGVSNIANAKKANAEAQGQIISNDFAVARELSNLDLIAEKTNNYRSLNKLNALRYQFDTANFETALNQSKANLALTNAQTAQAQAQTRLMQLQGDAQWTKNCFLPQQLQAHLLETLSIAELNGQLTKESAQRTIESYYRAQGYQISNEVASQLSDAYVSMTLQEYKNREDYAINYPGATRAINAKKADELKLEVMQNQMDYNDSMVELQQGWQDIHKNDQKWNRGIAIGSSILNAISNLAGTFVMSGLAKGLPKAVRGFGQ